MAESQPIDVRDLARKAGISLQDLEEECRDDHLLDFAALCDPWELVGYHLKLTQPQINAIKQDYSSHGAEMKRIMVLRKWKQSVLTCTYRALVEAFLKCNKVRQALTICEAVQDQLSTRDSEEIAHNNDAPANIQIPVNRTIRGSLRELDRHFSCVQMQLINTAGVTLRDLQLRISTLTSFSGDPTQLLRSSTIEEFFHSLKQHCNALCPDILEDLIEQVGDEEAKREMREFKLKCDAFQRETKLKDMIGNYVGPTSVPLNYKELEIKLGDSWREKTLEHLENLQCQISFQSRLLKMIREGSLTVTYLVPISLYLVIEDLIRYLQEQDVLQITMDEKCVFKQRLGTSSNRSPGWEMSPEDLHQVIYSDVSGITRKFSRLQAKVRQKITDHTNLVAHVLGMGILSGEEMEQIKEANSTDEVWIVITKYWSFLDYGRLDDIIENTCSEVEHEMMRKYDEDVKNFCERRVSKFQCESLIRNSNYSVTAKLLLVKLNLNDPPLSHVKNLKLVIANILGCKSSQLVLQDVGSGCVVVTYQVVPSIVHFFNELELTKEQEAALKDAQVISLKFASKFIFNREKEERPSSLQCVGVVDAAMVWGGYGSSTVVMQESSLQSDMEHIGSTVTIGASISGQYQFPANFKLVSAVYWLRCTPQCHLEKEVTIEIQHCAKSGSASKLSFVRALLPQKQLPYIFKPLEGGQFTNDSSYGILNLHQLSDIGLAIVQEGSEEKEYYASVYYLRKEFTNSQEIHFVVTMNTQAHRNVIEYEYKRAVLGSEQVVEFESDKITLDIPMEGMDDIDGWKIYPLMQPVIMKAEVDRFDSGKITSHCRLLARKVDPSKKEPLQYKINLKGAKKPHDAIIIHLEEIRLREGDLPTIYSKLEPHAAKWKEIGTALGFTQEELDIIEAMPVLMARAPKSLLRRMLAQWLLWAPGDGRGTSSLATMESLHDALLHTNLGRLTEQFS